MDDPPFMNVETTVSEAQDLATQPKAEEQDPQADPRDTQEDEGEDEDEGKEEEEMTEQEEPRKSVRQSRAKVFRILFSVL